MIFSKIILERMFSYADRQELDLSGCTPERNICLIIGRNGYGKTSLLNSLKLLFVGVGDERIRRVGFPPKSIKERQFVIGDGERWSGILNRRAAQTHRDCSITAVWHDQGTEVRATRRWEVRAGGNPDEQVEIRQGAERILDGDPARERLNQLCPPDIIPFFFFDGEQIQELAEGGDERRAKEFDRLLGLTFMDSVLEQLKSLGQDFQREGLPEEVRSRIVGYQTEIQRHEAELARLTRKLHDLQRQKAELDENRRTLLSRRERLKSPGSSEAEKARLDAAIDELKAAIGEAQNQLASDLPPLVPLLANPELVARGLELLETLIKHRLSADVQVLETLKAQLPRSLLETPPYPNPNLTANQKAFLAERLLRCLEVYGAPTAQPSTWTVSAASAEKLRNQFLVFRETGPDRRRTIAAQLRALSERKRQLKLRESDLLNLDVKEEEDRVRYQKLTAEIDDISGQLSAADTEIGRTESEIARQEKNSKESGALLKGEEQKFNSVLVSDQKRGYASASSDVLKGLRSHIKRSRRQAVEEAVNAHFLKLMDSHGLISHIGVDDDFRLTYHDDQNRVIGQGSVSHGMRQLVATALLWALKDVSKAKLPVFIDSPLARMDRGHRNNLLTRFYPNASDQIILLGTDSEMTEENIKLIEGRVYRQLNIVNDSSGMRSQFVYEMNSR